MGVPPAKLITTWQLVAKRSLANWRLLSSVVLGVLMASTIMAGTVIYFDTLRELALKKTLANHTASELNILVQGQMRPTSTGEYEKVSAVVNRQVDAYVDWMLTDRIRALRSPTFYLTTPGNEEAAGKDDARSFFAFLDGLEKHTTLLPGGRLPQQGRLSPPGEPLELEAIVPIEAAELFGVGVGDRLVAVPHWQSATPHANVVISGVVERNDPGDDIWNLEQRVLRTATGSAFRTIPFYVSERVFVEMLGPAFPEIETTYAWLLETDSGRVNAGNSELALASLQAMNRTLASNLASYQQVTDLDDGLKEYDRRLFFNRLPMFVVLILMAMVVLYYVATLSSLVAEERRGEVALLRSRGADSAQILAVFLLEGATITIIAVLAGPLIASGAISILSFTPAFSDLAGVSGLTASISGGAYLMSALGGVASFLALMIPAVQASRIEVTLHLQQSARPPSQPLFHRYYIDVFLLLISIFLFRQLTEQGSVVATTLFGQPAVDQLLLALPGLVLIASAMVLLRLFPLVLNLVSRIMSTRLSVGLTLGIWQMARNPTHYARLSLLLILAAGLGIFAASFGATLERSFEERVLYSTGSAVRVDGVRPDIGTAEWLRLRRSHATNLSRSRPRQDQTRIPGLIEVYEQVPGVEQASPVLRTTGHDLTKFFGERFVVLAVEGESFSDVAWFRDDFADRPMSGLLESLAPGGPSEGLELPYGALAIGIRIKPDRPHPSVRVTGRIMNAQNQYFTYDLGVLDSEDWAVLETSLGFGALQSLELSRPLTLVSLRFHESEGRRRLEAGSVLIDDLRVVTEFGETQIVEQFDDVGGWSVLNATPDAVLDTLHSGGDSASALFSWSEGNPLEARGMVHGPTPSSIPVLASEPFVKETGHSVGEEIPAYAGGYYVPFRLVDTIDLFPTMTNPDQSFLVADLTALSRQANLGAIHDAPNPNEVWISTTTSGPERDRLIQSLDTMAGYSSTSIHDRAQRLAESNADPLVEAGWRALLFIAFSAVLILSCLGFLVHGYVSFRNRQLQFALLKVVGLSRTQLLTTVLVEQALVIAAGMALGTWMGGRLGATIMPFLGHDDWGDKVLPPFAMQVNWGPLLITYGAMVFAFALITIGLMWLVRRTSLQRLLRLGEI